jgi:hypothetical protein
MKKILTGLLLVSMILTLLISCADDNASSGEQVTTTAADNTNNDVIEETTAPSYTYADADFGGEDFVILNAENIWDFIMVIDFEEMSGDSLEDAIYTRNRSVEERYNFNMVEMNRPIDELATVAQTSILAGDDSFQAAFVGAHKISSLVGSNYLYNLYDIPELKLNEYWFDKSVIDEGRIGNGDLIYFAATDLHLSAMDGTWCMMFNEDMAADLNMDKPYDLVRQGKWTIDRLQEYAKAGMNLNGDESFAWNEGGSSIYGYTSFDAASAALIFASGERFIKRDTQGNPYFALETERFFSVAERIAQLNATAGEYYSANEAEPSNHRFDRIFMNGRAFFIGCEIKMAPMFRNVDFTFGLVPFPKYSEDQESYSSMMFYQLLLLTVPVTNPDPERAGIIIDTLSYEAKQQVMPIYYDVYISQKGLRNEDSIEMLDLINQSRVFNVGNAYGWTLTLYDSIRPALDKGNSDMAALIAAQKSAIDANIEKTMSNIG